MSINDPMEKQLQNLRRHGDYITLLLELLDLKVYRPSLVADYEVQNHALNEQAVERMAVKDMIDQIQSKRETILEAMKKAEIPREKIFPFILKAAQEVLGKDYDEIKDDTKARLRAMFDPSVQFELPEVEESNNGSDIPVCEDDFV